MRAAGVARAIGFLPYSRLPELPLRLSILKLDGSSFDVQVGRAATVGELRAAVERVFSGSPKEGEGKISWLHVWSHFCLCYGGQMLIDDKMHLRTLGIKDGDQLHFIRHLSTTYTHLSSRPKSPVSTCEQPCMSSSGLVSQECQDGVKDGDESEGNDSEILPCIDESLQWNKEKEDLFQSSEFRLAHYLRGWLSYTRLWRRAKMRSDVKVSLSRVRRYCRRTASRGMNS